MSIQSEITLLQNTKDGLRTAIMEKGVMVPSSDLFSTYPTRISQISMTPGDKDSLFSDLIEANVLTSLNIPYGTSRIRWGAFDGQTQLTSVTIPSTVNEIDTRAFAYTGLTSVTIPSSVKSMGQFAFSYCTDLVTATFEDGAAVGCETFEGCTSLTSVTLPDDLSGICDGVFNSCTSLANITIPDSVTTIGNAAFENCSSLTEITISSGVTSIGRSAFNYCISLQAITCLSETPPTIDSYYLPFVNTNNCPIYVPKDSVDAYKASWPTYASRIQAVQELATFTKVTTDDSYAGYKMLGDGKYLIVDATHNIALNAPLIQSTTTSTSGLNARNNYVPVTISSDGSTAKAHVNVAVDLIGYNNGSAYLAWIDEDSGTTYYLTMTSNRFTYTNTTALPSQKMLIMYPVNKTGWAFTPDASRTIRLNTSGTRFQWLSLEPTSPDIVYPSLYKLVE